MKNKLFLTNKKGFGDFSKPFLLVLPKKQGRSGKKSVFLECPYFFRLLKGYFFIKNLIRLKKYPVFDFLSVFVEKKGVNESKYDF